MKNKISGTFLLMLLIATISIYLFNQRVNGTFLTCIDGDTFALQSSGSRGYYRLAFIDTPERKEKGYKEASKFTCNKLKEILDTDKEIIFDYIALDIYSRLVVDVIYDDTTLSKELIKEGLAIPFYLNTNDEILKLYEENKRK